MSYLDATYAAIAVTRATGKLNWSTEAILLLAADIKSRNPEGLPSTPSQKGH